MPPIVPDPSTFLDQGDFVRTLFEESSIGMNLCRMDGLWLRSNPALLRMLGYSRAEADGHLTYWQLTPPTYAPQEAEQLRALEETSHYGPFEKEFVRKDGTLVPVRLRGYLVQAGGERLIWSFVEDITAERALARERIAAIQHSKLAALGALAASIVHEINNPLTVVAAYADLLGTTPPPDEALVREAATQIQRAIERASVITDSLRRMARDSASGRADLPVAIDDVVREAQTLTAPRLRTRGLSMSVRIDGDPWVRGHAIQLGQILINLVNNAIDAVADTPEPEIRLTARRVGDEVEVRVEDSGPGVRDEHRHRLFEPFFTTKGVEEGTGLGLSISRQIAEGMHGTLTYERSDDRTRLVLRLPAIDPSPLTPGGRPATPS